MRSQNSSDLSVSGNSASTIARKYTYADLDLTFNANPMTGDINPVKDIEAIKRSVQNLILTNYQERPFQPEIGSGVRGLLFELADPITTHSIEQAIRRTIKNFEPRVSVLGVQVSDDLDNNTYNVTIAFQLIASEKVGNISIILERLR
jgi:phage baseplate assembly protein W